DERGSTKKVGLMAGGGIGTLVLLAVAYFLGVAPNKVPQIAGGLQKRQPGEIAASDDKNPQFSKTIMGMTEKVWHEQVQANGAKRRRRRSVTTSCRNKPVAGWTPASSPTAPPPSGTSSSARGSRPATRQRAGWTSSLRTRSGTGKS